MVEVINREGKSVNIKEGDVVFVLRDRGEEKAGIVYYVGNMLCINYGGVISQLHDMDQIRLVPEDIQEALVLRLQQNEKELQENIFAATENISDIFKEISENDTLFKYIRNRVKELFSK